MEGNILKKSRFIIFLKEIYTKDKFSCWLSVCMMLLSTFFVIFLPKLLQYIIDESMRGQQIKYILFFGGLYFFISLFNSLIIIKKEEILVRIKKSTLVRFKTRLLKKVSTLSGKALTEIKAGEMLNLIEGDTELLEACGLDIVFDTISNVITAILAIYILLKMQIGMFFVVFFLQLIVIWSQLKFTNILVEKTKKIRLKQDGIYASMQQYLGNIIVVILNKAKLLFFSEFVKKERSYQKECAELDIQYAVFDQIGSLFSSIIRVFIYTYGGMKIIKSQMTMGELIAFIEYTTLFINPCIRILKSNASIQKLKVSINRIYDFLEMKNSIAQNNYGIKIRNRINEIVFDNVSFSYDKKMVIENLSFKLERGKTYAFVGETGCGKSTIVNLLFRLWDTKSGNIMIDGENIKEYNLFSLRKQLSIATQNVYIKDDSIENNILMGRKKEDCAYDEICKLVGMESILSKFPKEKDVSVGENGNKLSGGQKQRIAMARALVHADNVLILVEATSALDNITQNEIMKNIKPLYQDKIVIIITHRLDTISDVDKIFVMSEGRICEEGQHNELMKKGEKYYALVQNL